MSEESFASNLRGRCRKGELNFAVDPSPAATMAAPGQGLHHRAVRAARGAFHVFEFSSISCNEASRMASLCRGPARISIC